MSESPNAAAADIEALKDLYAAINRNDLEATLRHLDPSIERIEPAGYPAGGTHRGHAEVLAHFAKGRAHWAEGSCDPEEFVVAGGKIVVFLHVRVRMKDRTDWIEGRFADGFEFRDGRAVLWRTFDERSEALEWAGVGAQ